MSLPSSMQTACWVQKTFLERLLSVEPVPDHAHNGERKSGVVLGVRPVLVDSSD